MQYIDKDLLFSISVKMMGEGHIKQLSLLIEMDSPTAVQEEVGHILRLISPDFNVNQVDDSFLLTLEIYGGCYPGYQACNVGYHDLRHITDTVLAMARLIHGAILGGYDFDERHILLGLVAALLHDVGYIQVDGDNSGTGAKYTDTHVKRSMDFLGKYGTEHGLKTDELAPGMAMIQCTDLCSDIATIDFSSPEVELLGKMLASADMIAQMSDRCYLEKLLYLYLEFREADVGGYEDVLDFYKKTVGFFDLILDRLDNILSGAYRFAEPHFGARWGVKGNLYLDAIKKHRKYLVKLLNKPDFDPRTHIRRGGISKNLYCDKDKLGS